MIDIRYEAAVIAYMGGKRLDRLQFPGERDTPIFGNMYDDMFIPPPPEPVIFEFPNFRMGAKMELSEESAKSPEILKMAIDKWAGPMSANMAATFLMEMEKRLESAIIRPGRER